MNTSENTLDIDIPKKIIAVTMATGLQGKGVVKQLSKTNKFQIRALTRNPSGRVATELSKLPNVKIYKANLLDHDSLIKCFNSAYGIFGNTTPTKGWEPLVREYEIEQGRVLTDVVNEIKERGDLKHFVFSSICKAKDPLKNEPAPGHFSCKWDIEEYIKQKELNDITTIIRPVSYFENFDAGLPLLNISKTTFTGIVKKDKIWQTIAVQDIGHWTTAIFNNPERFKNQSINIAGEELTGEQMAAILKKTQHINTNKVKYRMIPRLLIKLFVNDIGIMADWIERAGYGADINKLKKIAEEEGVSMTPLSTWLKDRGFTNT